MHNEERSRPQSTACTGCAATDCVARPLSAAQTGCFATTRFASFRCFATRLLRGLDGAHDSQDLILLIGDAMGTLLAILAFGLGFHKIWEINCNHPARTGFPVLGHIVINDSRPKISRLSRNTSAYKSVLGGFKTKIWHADFTTKHNEYAHHLVIQHWSYLPMVCIKISSQNPCFSASWFLNIMLTC